MLFEAFIRRKRSSWKRRTLFFGSIALHVVAGVGILGYSLFHVEELPPPEVTITFVNAPPPPAAPAPPAAVGTAPRRVAKTRLPKPKSPRQIAAAVIPPSQPKEALPPPPASAAPPPPAPPERPTSVAGTPGGVPNAPPSPAPPPPPVTPPPPPAPPPPPLPPGQAPKMVPNFVIDKERLAAPDPRLPEDFTTKHPGQTFSAVYRICVGTDGRVFQASVVSPIGGVDDVILAQIRKSWVYKPQPLPVCSHRAFVFKIRQAE